MDKEEIAKIINLALDFFYKTEKDLDISKIHERAICHRFAIVLEYFFPEYNLDCEYDRHGDDHKRLDEEIKKYRKTENPSDRALPDIIVHRRKIDKNNLCVFEIKSKEDATEEDIKKLELMTKKEGEENKRFGYDFGIFIKFEQERNNVPPIRIFEKGEETF